MERLYAQISPLRVFVLNVLILTRSLLLVDVPRDDKTTDTSQSLFIIKYIKKNQICSFIEIAASVDEIPSSHSCLK